MANRYPLIVDTTDGNKIKELPSGDALQLTGNSIIGVTDVTASGTIAGGVLSAASIMKGGTELASLAVTGAWSDVVGKPTQLSDFNNNLNFIVPGSNISILTNNAGYISTVAFSDLTTTPTTLAGYNITDGATSVQGALAGTALQPGANISALFNNAGYLTAADLAGGAITIDVNNTGDLVGSVFADDSTVMIDSILAAVNLDGTIRGNVSPNANQHNLWDLGTNAVRFKDAYFAGTINGALVGTLDGDLTGSVFGDDSTVLVDGVNSKIVGAVETASLRTSETSIALGSSAGQTTQGIDAVAIGRSSGQSNQRQTAVAIGGQAGKTNQDFRAVAIGYSAGEEDQGGTAVALGYQAGKTTQGDSAVALGYQSGWTAQGTYGIALGYQAGYENQGQSAIAIGENAGFENQAANSIVINATGAALNNTQADAFIVKPIRGGSGTTILMYDATSGEVTHTASPVITGDITGSVFGDDSTLLVDGINNKIVGPVLSSDLRSTSSNVTIGLDAGLTNQGTYSIAIGERAGNLNQSADGIAIGYAAGRDDQQTDGIAIGQNSGQVNQGASSVAIGTMAGKTNQHANTIILSATGATFDSTQANALFVKPIRNAVGTTMLMYDATSGEVTHSGNVTLGGDLDVGGNSIVSASNGAINIAPDGSGTIDLSGQVKFAEGMIEKFATTNGATGVTALDCSTGNVHYLTAPAGDITANFTNLGLTAEYATNLTVIINQGATPYEVTAVQIGGAAQTIEWQGGVAPTGNANGIDSFSFTILNDGGAYVVLGQMVDFT